MRSVLERMKEIIEDEKRRAEAQKQKEEEDKERYKQEKTHLDAALDLALSEFDGIQGWKRSKNPPYEILSKGKEPIFRFWVAFRRVIGHGNISRIPPDPKFSERTGFAIHFDEIPVPDGIIYATVFVDRFVDLLADKIRKYF